MLVELKAPALVLSMMISSRRGHLLEEFQIEGVCVPRLGLARQRPRAVTMILGEVLDAHVDHLDA